MAKKQLGQHWLKDQSALQAMVKAGHITRGEAVLEIGPGQGALTDKLAAAGAHITAVELDSELAGKLAKSYQDSKRIEVVESDILDFDLSRMPVDYKVVANIPYYLTAPLIKKLTTDVNPPKRLVLLVQKEVAQRLVAPRGELSILGVAAQLFGRVRTAQVIPAGAFHPAPKVDSQIVIIDRQPGLDNKQNAALMSLVRHGFSSRRKTLANCLAAGLRLDKSKLEPILKKSGIDQRARAQELTIEQWEKLYNYLNEDN